MSTPQDADATLQQRALEVRSRFAQCERAKYGREWTTRDILDGLVVDVGDLVRVVMAKEGLRDLPDVDERLAHELADVLWCVLVLADRLGVDLDASFTKTMDELTEILNAQS